MYKAFLGYKTSDHDNAPLVFPTSKVFNSKQEAEEWIDFTFKSEEYDSAEIEEISEEDAALEEQIAEYEEREEIRSEFGIPKWIY